MYSQSNGSCNCDNPCGGSNMGAGFGEGNPFSSPEPIMAPRKVCVSRSNRFVEQPVICPIECRNVQNIVHYPRYYPRYEQTFVVCDPNGNAVFNSNDTANRGY